MKRHNLNELVDEIEIKEKEDGHALTVWFKSEADVDNDHIAIEDFENTSHNNGKIEELLEKVKESDDEEFGVKKAYEENGGRWNN